MAPFDLSLADYEVLAYLDSQSDGQARMAELAATALVSRSRLTYRVDRMERAGLVRREPCDTDRRGSFAVITQRGRDLFLAAERVHGEAVRRYILGLAPANELRKIVETVERTQVPVADLALHSMAEGLAADLRCAEPMATTLPS